jgi:UDP-N-acetylglucosamine 3-dehydrogenase
VEWVMGQIDSRSARSVFGVRMETQGVSYFGYQNGARGMLIAGDQIPDATGGPTGRRSFAGAAHRIIGTAGILEVAAPDSKLRLMNGDAAGWQEVPLGSGTTNITESVAAAIKDALTCLGNDDQPLLSSHKAIRATELIFGTYESARRRARVDLPLDIEDNPLHSLLDSGEIGPDTTE